MFGELLGVWIADAWLAAGAPARASLVELGPGRGTLMADVLRVRRVAPRFLEAISVHLVETSPVLRDIQRQTLAKATPPIHWHDDFDEVPSGPAFILANEFFDALPVRQFVKAGPGWRERLVGLDARGALAFGLSGEAEPALAVPAEDGSRHRSRRRRPAAHGGDRAAHRAGRRRAARHRLRLWGILARRQSASRGGPRLCRSARLRPARPISRPMSISRRLRARRRRAAPRSGAR